MKRKKTNIFKLLVLTLFFFNSFQMLFSAERSPQGGGGPGAKRPCRLNFLAGIEQEREKKIRQREKEANRATDLNQAEWEAFLASFRSRKQFLADRLKGKGSSSSSFSSQEDIQEYFDLVPAFLACMLSLPREEGEPLEAKFPPSKKVEVGGKIFYLSRIFLEDERKSCVLYTKDTRTREMVSHFLYQSKSSGFWRVTPYIEPSQDASGLSVPGRFSKGSGLHYTQETALNPALLNALELLESEGKVEELHCSSLLSAFVVSPDFVTYGPNYFASRVRVLEISDRGLQACLKTSLEYMPGSCFIVPLGVEESNPVASSAGDSVAGSGDPAAGDPSAASDPAGEPFSSVEDLQAVIERINREIYSVEGFVPQFTGDPVKCFRLTHSMLGAVFIEVYSARLGRHPLEWFMARTVDEKHIWIERISLVDSVVSDYGTNSTFLNSGFLTNKTIEYSHNISGKIFEFKNPQNLSEPLVVLLEGTDYSLITAILEMLLPVKNFRRALLRRPSRT